MITSKLLLFEKTAINACKPIKHLFRKRICLVVPLLFAIAVVKGQTIHIEGQNLSLKYVLEEIKKQSGYNVFIRKDLLDHAKTVSFSKVPRSLREVLDNATAAQGLQYEIQGKEIIFSKKEIPTQPNKPKSTQVTNTSENRQSLIAGRVMDVSGNPISNATITSKNTGLKVGSDANGEFALQLRLPDELHITCIGFETKAISVRNESPIKIVLDQRTVGMEDVVVTGIFKRPEGNFTGSVTSLKGEDLKRVSSSDVFAAVATMDPSFRIIPNNLAGGNINQLPEVQMRGSNSMPNLSGELSANPNSPLFILDGFEVNIARIKDLDMNLIENITLLKDASATSIYGSRGANGVMVITTKLPNPGKVQVTINNDFRVSFADLSVYDMLNAKEKLDFEKRVGLYDYNGLDQLNNPREQYFNDKIYNDRLIAVESGVNTDWLAQPVQTGISDRTSVYLQGGDDYIRYGVQLAADLQSGVMKGQTRDNYSGQFDLSYKVKKLRFQNSLRVFQNVSNESPYGSFLSYVRMNPYWAPFDENGRVRQVLEKIQTGETSYTTFANPLYDATLHTVNKNQYFGIVNNFQLRYDMKPNLFFEANMSVNKQNGGNDHFLPAQHSAFINMSDVSRKGSYKVRNENQLGYEARFTGNYNKQFGKSNLFATAGYDIASNTINFYSISTEGFAFDKLDNLLFATQYEPQSKPEGDESKINRIGMLLQTSYSYDDRFLADLSIRRDGSSQFGSDKRFGTFWSTGLGWNIHKESFFKTNPNVNRLKIRGSYGAAGSINLPAYQARTRYNFSTSNIYNGELGASIKGLGNSNLSWQNVLNTNVGADIQLFKERLDLRLDYYRSLTKNSITQITLATSTGFSTYAENQGQIQNTGYELYGRFKLINRPEQGMIWSINASGAQNKNVLKSLSNQLKALNDKVNAASDQRATNVQLVEGASINTIYAVRSLGVDPITGNEIFLTKDGEKTFTWSVKDKVAVGVTDPKWNGLAGTQFDYQGFSLMLQFDYRFGGQIYNQTLVDRVENVDPTYNVDSRAYNLGWTKPGDHSPYTRIKLAKTLTRVTSRFVQDESTINLNTLSLTYNFYKHAFVKKWGLNSAQITAISNDVFRMSTVKMERGLDNPYARTFSVSLRAGF